MNFREVQQSNKKQSRKGSSKVCSSEESYTEIYAADIHSYVKQVNVPQQGCHFHN